MGPGRFDRQDRRHIVIVCPFRVLRGRGGGDFDFVTESPSLQSV